MSLSSNPGRLALRSTHADINQHPGPTGSNLGEFEAPGVLLPDVFGKDFRVSALFRDVRVPNGSDQLMLYAGTSETNLLRAGFHELNVYLFSENQGTGDDNTILSPFDAFDDGDDIVLTLSRSAGVWMLAWENLSNPTASGSGPGFSLSWLDDEPDLFVGVLAASAGTTTTFLSQVDWFSVTVVAEPSTICLATTGLLFVGAFRRTRVLSVLNLRVTNRSVVRTSCALR